jgi:hypothetical protein
MKAFLILLIAVLAGCTTVHDLGGGRYMVPRVAEVRSPFGTNAGFVMLETCDGIPHDASWTEPLAGATEYRNCQPYTAWIPISSQGQGGQILSGILQAGALVGAGALIQGPSAAASVSQSIVVNPATKGKH